VCCDPDGKLPASRENLYDHVTTLLALALPHPAAIEKSLNSFNRDIGKLFKLFLGNPVA